MLIIIKSRYQGCYHKNYNINPHILQFELNDKYSLNRWNQILDISGFHKLNHHNIYNENNTMYSNIIEIYLKRREGNKHE